MKRQLNFYLNQQFSYKNYYNNKNKLFYTQKYIFYIYSSYVDSVKFINIPDYIIYSHRQI